MLGHVMLRKKILNNNSVLVKLNELEETRENWKNQTMISFATSKNLLMNLFISWHKLIDDALNNKMFNKYQTTQLSETRI